MKASFRVLSLVSLLALSSLNACLVADTDLGALDVDSTEQALQTCTATCDPPTYNGVPVSCSSPVYCVAHSSGAYCDNGAGGYVTVSCSTCGNGTCDANETESSCPGDCSPGWCGDGWCDGNELPWTCPYDCGYCGDGYCVLDEPSWCYSDCGYQCNPRFECPIVPVQPL